MNSKVVSNNKIKPRLGIMKFKPDKHIDFKAGQFCHIKLKTEEKLMRPYSMTSLPDENVLEFYIKAYEDGKVAKHILKLEKGDEAEIIGPYGKFFLQENNKDVYFISAGSGVAPLMSMARKLKGSKKKITFIQCASYVADLVYEEELREMDRSDSFTYLPTISRPEENPDWKGETGRVDSHLDVCTNTEAEVYICGPPPMVDQVKEIMLEKGFLEENVFVEKYY